MKNHGRTRTIKLRRKNLMAEIKDINVLTVRGRIGAKYAPPERQWLSTAIAINRQGVEATDFSGHLLVRRHGGLCGRELCKGRQCSR